MTDAGEYPLDIEGIRLSAPVDPPVRLPQPHPPRQDLETLAQPGQDSTDVLPIIDVQSEEAALLSLGFARPLILAMRDRARMHGTTIERELLHSGSVSEDAYYGAIARAMRLPFIDEIAAAAVQDIDFLDSQLVTPRQVRINHPDRAPQIALVPEAALLADFSARLLQGPQLAQQLVITTPSAIRNAVWAAGAQRRVKHTVAHLFDRQPHHSARIVATGWQGWMGGCAVTGLIALLLVYPAGALQSLHAGLSLVYLSALIMRLWAVGQKRPAVHAVDMPVSPPLPVYTIMVALYREAGMVAQLVANLERLDWPRSLLDIKLACEADDRETIDALKAMALPPYFDIVEVPACHPRTKPKALTYALAGARGEFLTIYDAEDRPHPQQLREAYARFRCCDENVACLQAPLIIANLDANSISTMFALEYAALFRAMLPMLANHRLPLPLGGTSNHFRTQVLRDVGGWDPFNVTEDADLGLRLYRLNYRAQTLRCQTLEDAPLVWRVWIGQRTRWFKGWLQTWLVMTRAPVLCARQMGLRAALSFHLLIGGMLASALLHPLIIAFVIEAGYRATVLGLGSLPFDSLVLLCVDAANVSGSYLIFLKLGIGAMIARERQMLGWRWISVPVHWFMSSYAAWRALNELRTDPFFWKKTPHLPTNGVMGDAISKSQRDCAANTAASGSKPMDVKKTISSDRGILGRRLLKFELIFKR
ncbi:glycosyltransferase family 2 protein [Rhizobium sp. SSA_523]|uniref:glycosyltransferase family 2 protein n=1 Tax=Rhizobium sp. SSA_523 TaxID=2952477 RepID=UPI0020907759|nr:glycosyltransferase family 2 protein [Rhizobium sp. SSA_523]MCO5732922.1 glycosyltransferase [Rhizobium sp. SSA_523]WKC23811.1 glycosyltransferase family 2 protein [Rhizobium sp. SSA_523]